MKFQCLQLPLLKFEGPTSWLARTKKLFCFGSAVVPFILKININHLHYALDITPKRVTSGGAHLLSLAPGLRSFEKTSQRW